MDYNSFVEEIKTQVEKNMGGQYYAKVHQVVKNNGIELQGLVIFEKGKKEISPTIYLEPFYRKYVEDFSLQVIVKDIIGIYNEIATEVDIHMPDTDFDKAKESIVYRLTGYGKNKKLLDDIPHIRFLDLAITFHYLYSITSEGVRSFRITNSILEQWNASVKELYQIANENTQRLFPIVIRSIDEVVGEIIGGKERESNKDSALGSEDIIFEWLRTNENKQKNFLVLTNESGINGATSMIYSNVIATIANEWETDVFVLPSSIQIGRASCRERVFQPV
jgi:hypothetical protein